MVYIEIAGYLAATLTTISFVPQALQVIKTKDTHSI
ncbi:MAG: PQ-loop domain-containing transporter, partial [Bacteroidota bacterium]